MLVVLLEDAVLERYNLAEGSGSLAQVFRFFETPRAGADAFLDPIRRTRVCLQCAAPKWRNIRFLRKAVRYSCV